MTIVKRILFLTLVLLTVSSCEDFKTPIKIGVNSWPPCEIWYIAEKMGYFHDTPVEIVRFSTWTDNMGALYLGKIDITHSTYFNAVYYSDKGEEGQIILSSDTIVGADGLVIKEYLEKGEKLRGKKIAVEVNTDEHFLLQKALERYDLKEEDITIIPVKSVRARDMFITGTVDACFLYEPFLTDAAVRGNGKIIFTTADLQGYMIDALVAKKNTVRRRAKDLGNILTAWYGAQEYISKNPEESFHIMGEKEGMDPSAFGDFYNSFTFFSAEENIEIFVSTSFKDKIQEMNDFIYNNGGISEKITFEDIYTTKIVKRIGK